MGHEKSSISGRIIYSAGPSEIAKDQHRYRRVTEVTKRNARPMRHVPIQTLQEGFLDSKSQCKVLSVGVPAVHNRHEVGTRIGNYLYRD